MFGGFFAIESAFNYYFLCRHSGRKPKNIQGVPEDVFYLKTIQIKKVKIVEFAVATLYFMYLRYKTLLTSLIKALFYIKAALHFLIFPTVKDFK